MSARLFSLFRLFALVLPVIAGCADPDDIKTTKVPKSPADAKAPAAEYRILGAVFPADDPVWFFKLTGPEAKLAEHEAGFDEFLKSVRFPNGLKNGPLWDLPAGWREGPPRQMRYATVLVGPDPRPLELSVSSATGGLKANLDRWAGQVGAADAANATKELTTTAGAKGLRIDLRGPKDPASGTPTFMGGR
jgi:hypothetical protein